MPTFSVSARFWREYIKLSVEEKLQFAAAYKQMVADMKANQNFNSKLHLHQMTDRPGIYEVRWGKGGRATFEFGPEHVPGQRHVIWRRIGGHEIYDDP